MRKIHAQTTELQKKSALIRRRTLAPQAAYRRAQVNLNGPTPANLLAMQRTVGNRQVQRILESRFTDNPLGDKLGIRSNQPSEAKGQLPLANQGSHIMQKNATALVQRVPDGPSNLEKLRKLLRDDQENQAISLMRSLSNAEKEFVLNSREFKELAISAFNNDEMYRAMDALHGDLYKSLEWMFAEGTDWDKVRAIIRQAWPGKDRVRTDNWMKAQFVDTCNDEEMAEAVDLLGGTLLQKLTWMKAEDANWNLVKAKLQATTDAAQKTALYDRADMRAFFVDVCNDEEMAEAVDLLGGTLLQKLTWMKAEDANWKLVKAKLQRTTDAVEKTALYGNTAMRDFFMDVCDNEEMAEAVQMIGGALVQKLQWMLAEGTDFELVASVIRLTPAAELPTVVADKKLMDQLRNELSARNYQTVQEMLTQGLLWKGSVAHETEGTEFEQWMQHTRGEITISKGVNFVEKGTFAPGKFNALKQRMIQAVTTYLSRKYKIKIESTTGTPKVGDGEYPIVIQLQDNPSADYDLKLRGGEHGRGAVGESTGNIYELGQASETLVPDVYLAHESAHLMLGANDEYADASRPARTVYTDNSLMGDFYAEGIAKAEIKARHFQYLVSYISKYFPDRNISIVK